MNRTQYKRAFAALTLAALSLTTLRTVTANAAQTTRSDDYFSPVQMKPDLAITTLEHYKVGDSYKMRSIVKNKGTAPSQACQLRMKIHVVLNVNNSYVTSWQFRDIPALAPGEEYTASGFGIGPIQAGTQPRFMVDSEHSVAESNEYNNYGLYEF